MLHKLHESQIRHSNVRVLIFCLFGLSALIWPFYGSRGQAQTVERCFPETDQCMRGRIREFWEQNGGLPVFGFPIGPQHEELIEGQRLQVQWFERNRLELHPKNTQPYDVLLGRLGADRLNQQGRDWFLFPKGTPRSGCRFFPETGHNVCGDILAAWRARGLEFDGGAGKSEVENLALFGLPLSDSQMEIIEGREYVVQWFERARFELHPENVRPYNVLLGLLGNEISKEPLVVPSPTPTLSPTSTSTPTPTDEPPRPRPKPPTPTPKPPTPTPTRCPPYPIRC
jgi:hypothetical protein